mgnify:CR=1 FL=1
MRKNNLLKKTAWIVLSAVLFGTVAGTVMTGIQIASSGMVSQFFAIVASDEDTVKAEGEALPPPEPFSGRKDTGNISTGSRHSGTVNGCFRDRRRGNANGCGSCQHSRLPDSGLRIQLVFRRRKPVL